MTEEHARAIFLLAGIKVERVFQIANKYSHTRSDPWWLVKTEHGLIEIGWRKRVIAIDWSDTPVRTIITPDEVTKDQHMVHAWGYPKAVQYLSWFSLVANTLNEAVEG